MKSRRYEDKNKKNIQSLSNDGDLDVDYNEFKDRVSSMSRRPNLKEQLDEFKKKYPYFWIQYQKEQNKKLRFSKS